MTQLAVVTKTLTQLIDDVRMRANLLNSTANGATDPRITDFLNNASQELHDLILSVDQSYYVQSYDFTLPDPVLQALYTAQNLGTAPVNWSACPGGFYKDIGLDLNPTLPTPITCRNFNFAERNQSGKRRASHTYRPLGRNAGVQTIEHLCGNSSDQTAGAYRLWFVGRAPVLAPVTIINVTIGSNSVSSINNQWIFSNASFTAADIGTLLVVSGASNSQNNGTFMITSVLTPTLVITNGTVITETFSTSVLASYQPGGTANALDDVQQIWNKYLTVTAAMELLGIEEDDESPLAKQRAEIKDRVLNMAANRTSEPESLPIVESFGGDYFGGMGDAEDWNT